MGFSSSANVIHSVPFPGKSAAPIWKGPTRRYQGSPRTEEKKKESLVLTYIEVLTGKNNLVLGQDKNWQIPVVVSLIWSLTRFLRFLPPSSTGPVKHVSCSSSILPQYIIKYVRISRPAKGTAPERARPLVSPDFGVLFILSAALVLFSSVWCSIK